MLAATSDELFAGEADMGRYTKFLDNPSESQDHFLSRLKQPFYMTGIREDPEWISLSVPSLVSKVLSEEVR